MRGLPAIPIDDPHMFVGIARSSSRYYCTGPWTSDYMNSSLLDFGLLVEEFYPLGLWTSGFKSSVRFQDFQDF